MMVLHKDMNVSTEKNMIRQVLNTEVKWIIGIVVFVFAVARPYYETRQDIALIQKDISNINANHEVHIQDILQELKEQRDEMLSIEKQMILISKNQ